MNSERTDRSRDQADFQQQFAVLQAQQRHALGWSLKGIPIVVVAAMLLPKWIYLSLLIGGASAFVIQFGGAEVKKTLLLVRSGSHRKRRTGDHSKDTPSDEETHLK